MNYRYCIVLVCLAVSGPAFAAEKDLTVTVSKVNAGGIGEAIGTVTFSDSAEGLKIVPRLTSLPPGPHGFHIHQQPTCQPAEKEGKMSAAEAAGGHMDPATTGKHEGPHGSGHLGDLPVLTVSTDGSASTTLIAPRLTLKQIQGHSLMIHAGADNFSDSPKKLGGGGERIACGVIRGPADS